MTFQFISFVLHLFPFFVQNFNQDVDIRIEMKNVDQDIIYVEYLPFSKLTILDEPYLDTIYLENGIAYYINPTSEPIYLKFILNKSMTPIGSKKFRPDQKQIELVHKPGEQLRVIGKLLPKYMEYNILGSEYNEEWSHLRSRYIENESLVFDIHEKIFRARYGQETLIDEKQLFQQRAEIESKSDNIKIDYVRHNLDQELSAMLLMYQKPDTLAKYYPQLSTEIRTGLFEELLKFGYQNFLKQSAISKNVNDIIEGSHAPMFSLPDRNGQKLSLSSIDKKIIVIDFWGSWCGWCIQDFPRLKKYYQEYSQSIEIIGIACNDKEADWVTAIEKYDLPWLQVLNPKDLSDDVSVLYGVNAYPTKFILNQEFKVLGKYVGSVDDFYKALDLLLKK